VKNQMVLLATLAAIGFGVSGVRAEEKTLTGKISDSLCGASHAEMAAKQGSKISERDCVIACLSYSTQNSPKLVFVGRGGEIYQIANQKFSGLMRRVGETLSVTGDVSGNTLTIARLEVSPAKPK
jgi:hypothetical protein